MSTVGQYVTGDVVWVRCGQLFWPAQILDFASLPAEVREDFDEKKLPKLTVKFFDEDGYEFLFDTKNLYPYNCAKKEEFIRKGIARNRSRGKEFAAGDGLYSKFPKDVVRSEELTGGDPAILEKDPYVERNAPRINYKELFGTPASDKKGKKKQQQQQDASPEGRKRKASHHSSAASSSSSPKMKNKGGPSPPPRPIVHPRFRAGGGGSDHQVKILPQPSAPYHLDLQMKQEKNVHSNAYTCHVCGFSATRLNVIVLHQKSHSEPARNKASANSCIQSKSNTSTARKFSPASSGRKCAGGASGSVVQSSRCPDKEKACPASAPTSKSLSANGKNSETTPKRRTKPPRLSGADKRAPSAAVPSTCGVTGPVAPKRKRLTKKQKMEQVKKIEERNSILDEWDEEEEDEDEERKKMNETMGKSSDSSDDDFDRDAFLGDDNVHGYDDDEEEKNEEVKKDLEGRREEQKEEEGTEKEEQCEKAKGEEEEEKIAEESATEGGEEKKPDGGGGKGEELMEDIGKVLEDTKVPDLPCVEAAKAPRRSVKFSDELAKEMQQKKIPLMELPSNLEAPEDVEDEFASSDDREVKAARPILKQLCQSSQKMERRSDACDEEPADEEKARRESELKSQEETVSTLLSLGNAGVVVGNAAGLQENGQQVIVQGSASSTFPATAGLLGEQEETYILLVDESSSQVVDSLNSQLLYLDSNSLANGNVVLMTEDEANAATTCGGSDSKIAGPSVASSENANVAVLQVISSSSSSSHVATSCTNQAASDQSSDSLA